MSKVESERVARQRAEQRQQWAWDNWREVERERDLLMLILTHVFPSHLMPHTHSPTSKGRRLVMCIHSPVGHLTWTVPAEYQEMVSPRITLSANDWDGARTSDKYERLIQLARDGWKR